MISLESVSVTTPDDRTILHRTTLTLSERRVAIIGANGSGKSTLARLLNGLITPSTGTVRIGELDTVRDGAAVRRRVGFVFTDPAAQLIMPTPQEDIELSLRASHPRAQERTAAASEILARFGLTALAQQSVHTLSGGQKQLLALATVLATAPEILVADEPTTLLDRRNTRAIADRLFSLPQQLILVTHDLELAARAERCLVIEEGTVVFDGEAGAATDYYRDITA